MPPGEQNTLPMDQKLDGVYWLIDAPRIDGFSLSCGSTGRARRCEGAGSEWEKGALNGRLSGRRARAARYRR